MMTSTPSVEGLIFRRDARTATVLRKGGAPCAARRSMGALTGVFVRRNVGRPQGRECKRPAKTAAKSSGRIALLGRIAQCSARQRGRRQGVNGDLFLAPRLARLIARWLMLSKPERWLGLTDAKSAGKNPEWRRPMQTTRAPLMFGGFAVRVMCDGIMPSLKAAAFQFQSSTTLEGDGRAFSEIEAERCKAAA